MLNVTWGPTETTLAHKRALVKAPEMVSESTAVGTVAPVRLHKQQNMPTRATRRRREQDAIRAACMSVSMASLGHAVCQLDQDKGNWTGEEQTSSQLPSKLIFIKAPRKGNIRWCLVVPCHLAFYALLGRLALRSAQPLESVWNAEQKCLFEQMRSTGCLSGDGRCDSLGFSTKYGTYSVYSNTLNKNVHTGQVQVGENHAVQASLHMEKVGFARGFTYLQENNIDVLSFTTDRHVSIKKGMASNHPDVNHYFNVWHFAKGMR
ncbi:uncharacterized protein ISCGN_012768 [Ixodes scapularis]